jgi:phosphoribosylformylglycinamidine synthase
MAAKGEVGIDLDLDHVPQRETGMTAYEMMLSESQERMLMVLKPGREDVGRRIFEKWGLDFAVIGKTTETGRMVLRHKGEVVADLRLHPLAEEAPVYERPYEPTEAQETILATDIEAPVAPSLALTKLMGCPDLASRRWIWEQYDHTVMADTVLPPGQDAALVRVHGTQKGLAITTDVTPRYVAADPVEGGKQAIAEAWRNLTAVGAEPLAVTDCMNFGNPEKPLIMGQFAGSIEGMAAACTALAFPVVSGNVSLYNETQGRAIQPCPAIGGVGLVDDLDRLATLPFKAVGNVLLLVGETAGHMGQSLYLRELLGREEGAPPPVDLAAEKVNGDFVRTLIRSGKVESVHDVSDGGLYVAVAEMALASGIGAHVEVPSGAAEHGFLFGEDQGRYVLEVTAEAAQLILADAAQNGVPARRIGETGGDTLTLNGKDPLDLRALKDAHETFLPGLMAAPATSD